MKKTLLLLLLIFGVNLISSQQISTTNSASIKGKITNEDGAPIPGVLVVNTTKDAKTTSDSEGNFSIQAAAKDDVRFAKAMYERDTRIISEGDFGENLTIVLKPATTTIEEVKIYDKKSLAARVEASIGLPKGPEKPREVPPPTMKQVGALKFLASNTKLENLYKNLSGDARRMRALYSFEDAQERTAWLQKNMNPDFFTENKIPEEKISEFFIFAFARNPALSTAVKQRNMSRAEFILDEIGPQFVVQMKQK